MGGNAFASGKYPLHTPRMPHEVFKRVLDENMVILRNFYAHVASPIEAPGKESYGDVDFLVAEPLDKTFKDGVAEKKLKEVTHAVALKREKGNPTINLAVPWPQDLSGALTERETSAPEEEVEPERKFVQVDVSIYPDERSFKWEVFHKAHGDLWNLLGSTIRRYGLTVNNKGLYIRIPEIQELDRKRSLVFLTDDHDQVLDFLGLDKEKYWTPFKSQQALFEYAATCRMFWTRELVEGEEVGDVYGKFEGLEGGEAGKKKLKHNDRQRMRKRPMFAAWINEFIPKLRKGGEHCKEKVTEDQLREEAFKKFGVEEEYNTRLTDEMMRRNIYHARELLKSAVPLSGVDSRLRAAAIRTLRSIIFDGEEVWEELQIPSEQMEALKNPENGTWILGKVKAFVAENWEKVGKAAMARQETKYANLVRPVTVEIDDSKKDAPGPAPSEEDSDPSMTRISKHANLVRPVKVKIDDSKKESRATTPSSEAPAPSKTVPTVQTEADSSISGEVIDPPGDDHTDTGPRIRHQFVGPVAEHTEPVRISRCVVGGIIRKPPAIWSKVPAVPVDDRVFLWQNFLDQKVPPRKDAQKIVSDGIGNEEEEAVPWKPVQTSSGDVEEDLGREEEYVPAQETFKKGSSQRKSFQQRYAGSSAFDEVLGWTDPVDDGSAGSKSSPQPNPGNSASEEPIMWKPMAAPIKDGWDAETDQQDDGREENYGEAEYQAEEAAFLDFVKKHMGEAMAEAREEKLAGMAQEERAYYEEVVPGQCREDRYVKFEEKAGDDVDGKGNGREEARVGGTVGDAEGR